MKFRSGLLVACMIVVPMLAMFSHHVPDGLISTASRLVYEPLVSRLSATLTAKATDGNGVVPAASPPQSEAKTGPLPTPAAGPTRAVLSPPAVPESRTPPSEPAAHVAALATPPASALPVPAGAGPAVARLAALGALSIECQPTPGVVGSHRASCRIPVDAEGQLHRVFQATGADRAAAEQNLLEDVLATQRRALR